jgi:hypothetical protein
MTYYDFNFKRLTVRDDIASRYGAAVAEYSDERLAELKIYPIGPAEPVPAGKKVNPLQSAEEKEAGGPVFTLVDGFAIQKRNYITSDPLASKHEKLWEYLTPSKTLAEILTLASTDLADNVQATLLLNALTEARVAGREDSGVLTAAFDHFHGKLSGEAKPELGFILGDSNLRHLLTS